MALSPQDLVLSANEIIEANSLEEKIDKQLKERSVGEPKLFAHVGPVSTRVLGEVIRRYEAVGWKKVYRPVEDYNLLRFEA